MPSFWLRGLGAAVSFSAAARAECDRAMGKLSVSVAIFKIPTGSTAVDYHAGCCPRHESNVLHGSAECSNAHGRAHFIPNSHAHIVWVYARRMGVCAALVRRRTFASPSRIANELEVKVQRAAVALELPAKLLDVTVRLGAPAWVRIRPQVVARLTRKLADRAQWQVV